jgi:hypothetical protein
MACDAIRMGFVDGNWFSRFSSVFIFYARLEKSLRNVHVPFSEIADLEKDGKGYKIKFKNNQEVLKQIGFFKPFVKYNLENNNFALSDTHSTGDIDGFFVELGKKIS